jgi:hypothetical protein
VWGAVLKVRPFFSVPHEFMVINNEHFYAFVLLLHQDLLAGVFLLFAGLSARLSVLMKACVLVFASSGMA